MMHVQDDQDNELKTRGEEILKETEKIVGTSRFFGEIWKTMLRTPKCALHTIRYLKKRIPENVELAV
jgi:hypothetical protein